MTTFNIDKFSDEELKNLVTTLLVDGASTVELHELGKYIDSLYEKDVSEVLLTEKEEKFLTIQSQAYDAFVIEHERLKVLSTMLDNMTYAQENLSRLLKKVSMSDIVKEKPALSEIPEGMKCMALKILDKSNYEWVFSSGNLNGAEFVLHESVDGSVENEILSMKKTVNQQIKDTGCKCACHNEKTHALHMMACCSMTYRKLFTNLI